MRLLHITLELTLSGYDGRGGTPRLVLGLMTSEQTLRYRMVRMRHLSAVSPPVIAATVKLSTATRG